MTSEQAKQIRMLIGNYRYDERCVKRTELVDMMRSIYVTSPKTGKPIRPESYVGYREGKMLKNLSKYDMIWYLNHFLENEKIQPESSRGFFAA